MRFFCEPNEVRHGDGHLYLTGVTWNEARTFRESVLTGFSAVTFILTLAALGMCAFGFSNGRPWAWNFLLVTLGFGYLTWFFMTEENEDIGTQRRITFEVSGSAYAPDGLASGVRRRSKLSQPHSQIESIEVEQISLTKGGNGSGYTHGVCVYYSDGSIQRVAQYLEAKDAHMLAVRLVRALELLRADLGTVSNNTMPHREAGRRQSAELIN